MATIHPPKSSLSGPKLPPQVVLLLDDDVRVLNVNRGLAGTKFESIFAGGQRSLHSQLHPDCDGKCRFNELWVKAWSALENRGSVEWEVHDPELKRLLRLNLSAQPVPKNVEPDRRKPHKILTITDITKYRREYESLVQRQQDLVERLLEQGIRPLERDNEVADFLSDTGNRLVVGIDAENRSFGRQLIMAQEEECKRIALELHDGISQSISVVKYKIEASLARLAEQHADLDLSDLGEIVDDVKDLIGEIRRISNNLAPSVLEDFGIQVALDILCREFSSHGLGLQAKFTSLLDEGELQSYVKIAIYRIAQEALNNAAKHSSATQIDVSLSSTSEGVTLEIADNGSGADLHAFKSQSGGHAGLGLRSMRERVAATGGRLAVESSPGNGFAISVLWPSQAPGVTQ